MRKFLASGIVIKFFLVALAFVSLQFISCENFNKDMCEYVEDGFAKPHLLDYHFTEEQSASKFVPSGKKITCTVTLSNSRNIYFSAKVQVQNESDKTKFANSSEAFSNVSCTNTTVRFDFTLNESADATSIPFAVFLYRAGGSQFPALPALYINCNTPPEPCTVTAESGTDNFIITLSSNPIHQDIREVALHLEYNDLGGTAQVADYTLPISKFDATTHKASIAVREITKSNNKPLAKGSRTLKATVIDNADLKSSEASGSGNYTYNDAAEITVQATGDTAITFSNNGEAKETKLFDYTLSDETKTITLTNISDGATCVYNGSTLSKNDTIVATLNDSNNNATTLTFTVTSDDGTKTNTYNLKVQRQNGFPVTIDLAKDNARQVPKEACSATYNGGSISKGATKTVSIRKENVESDNSFKLNFTDVSEYIKEVVYGGTTKAVGSWTATSVKIPVSNNMTVKVVYGKETTYTIKHEWENVDDDNYTTHETETSSTGTLYFVGQTITATAKNYDSDGFQSATNVMQELIDGANIISINYKRKRYTVTFGLEFATESDPTSKPTINCTTTSGTVSENTLTIKHGGSATFDVSNTNVINDIYNTTPNWKVDNEEPVAVATKPLSNVTENHTVKAEFCLKPVDGSSPNAWKKLKDTIAKTKSGGTVQVRGTINATSATDNYGEITINKSVTIKATSGTATLDANCAHTGKNHRIFNIKTKAIVTLEKLTLTHAINASTDTEGFNIHGGAIFVATDSKLTMKNCTIQDCKTKNDIGSGGGIAIQAKGIVSLENTTIKNCIARWDGGGVWASGIFQGISATLTMKSGSVITSCKAGCGGGVYLYQGGKLEMLDGSSIANCSLLGLGENGKGVYVYNGTNNARIFTMKGSALVNANNDVYLANGCMITVDGTLSKKPAATITPNTYAEGLVLATGSSATKENFAVTPNGSETYVTVKDGNDIKLKKE